ncbi:hypothetical protein M3P05_14820 [Sansalvadorimonas sp. 2012CJ34-2]|uniref:Tetratricopeptide repeat protein n=1 Tax=Parendozoicomonas callyspongiae TaxID=2942213 RepID=A0ABT0PJP4_9GAMM|nr:hypothetical protein [Sansalvadorimonas sp. 2012CJ34-2]MCL6271196.1 hypothetical protein [Sansalvadorimonas sp. 2012CJ34-2]
MHLVRHFIAAFLFMWAVPVLSAHYHGDVDAYPPWKGGKGLGELDLDVSTNNEEARQHFLTGLKLTHVYEFPEATWSFREAQRLDPAFAMAYWGEIMASHMFVWYAKEPEQAQAALHRMKQNADFSRLNEKEKGLISAGRLLVEGKSMGAMPFDKGSLLSQFRDQLGVLYKRFPDDHEIKVLYGYSVLGTRRGVRDFKVNQKARQLFLEVLKENSEHPGAMHYLIHASENAAEGYWARQAAETFGEIVSASIHASHMPSHYYYAVGDWDKVIEINRHAWKQSKQRIADIGLNEDNLEYHGVGWISYGLLQQGKFREAKAELDELYELYQKKPSATKMKYLLFARAGYLVDSPFDSKEFAEIRRAGIDFKNAKSSAVAANIFADGYAAWLLNDSSALKMADKQYDMLMKMDLSHLGPPDQDAVLIMQKLLKALVLLEKGQAYAAEVVLADACKIEDNMVHEHGIPLAVKPANEMYGDFLRESGRPGEAIYFYNKSLSYQPARLKSLQGIARSKDMLKEM